MSITQFRQEMRGHLPILWERVSPRRRSLSEEQPPRKHSIGSRDPPDAVMHPNRIGTWKRASGRRESKATIYRMRSKWREIVQLKKREPENRPQIEEIGLGEHDIQRPLVHVGEHRSFPIELLVIISLSIDRSIDESRRRPLVSWARRCSIAVHFEWPVPLDGAIKRDF